MKREDEAAESQMPAAAGRISRAALPPAAQRWLGRALPPGMAAPSSVRIEQVGELEVRGRWTPFRASGTYTAAPLAFEWRARLSLLPGVWVVAEDGQRDGRGWGGARLWGLFSMGAQTGPEVLAAQRVRNLGELPWFPAFALAENGLTWTEAGESACVAQWGAGEAGVTVRFDVDAGGDVVRASSPARPYDVPGGFAAAPWVCAFSDHQDFGGVRIPARAVARFEKPGGVWEYFRCRLTALTPVA